MRKRNIMTISVCSVIFVLCYGWAQFTRIVTFYDMEYSNLSWLPYAFLGICSAILYSFQLKSIISLKGQAKLLRVNRRNNCIFNVQIVAIIFVIVEPLFQTACQVFQYYYES